MQQKLVSNVQNVQRVPQTRLEENSKRPYHSQVYGDNKFVKTAGEVRPADNGTIHDYLLEYEVDTPHSKLIYNFHPQFNFHHHKRHEVVVERNTNKEEAIKATIEATEAAERERKRVQIMKQEQVIQLLEFQEKVRDRVAEKNKKDKLRKQQKQKVLYAPRGEFVDDDEEVLDEVEEDPTEEFERQRARKTKMQEYSQKVFQMNKKKLALMKKNPIILPTDKDDESSSSSSAPTTPDSSHLNRPRTAPSASSAPVSPVITKHTKNSPAGDRFMQELEGRSPSAQSPAMRKISSNLEIPFYYPKNSPKNDSSDARTQRSFQSRASEPAEPSTVTSTVVDSSEFERNPTKAARQILASYSRQRKSEPSIEVTRINSARSQKSKEERRYFDAIRERLIQKIQESGVTLPPVCNCNIKLFDKHCNNCEFYNNPKGYMDALENMMHLYGIPTSQHN